MRLACGVLRFSPQAFYAWRANPVSDRDWSDAHVTNALVDAHADDPEFGYRFLADELARAGVEAGERRVWRLCRDQRVWSTTVRKGRRGGGETPGPAVHDDLVRRVFTAPAPDLVWLTDLTENPTMEGKLYCCAIKDVLSNRVVGHATGDRMTASLAVAALRSAIARRQPAGTVVVHSDRGSQFRSPSLPRRVEGERAHRLDGARRRSRRQRRHGVVLLPAAAQRLRPAAALAHPRRAVLRDHRLDRAHLQPTPPSARTGTAHPGRVRARLHRPGRSRCGMITTHPVKPILQQSQPSNPSSPASR